MKPAPERPPTSASQAAAERRAARQPNATIRWTTAIELVLFCGAIGQAAYLIDPVRHRIGLWGFAAILLVPYVLLTFFRHGELPERTVAITQALASLWYLVLTAIVGALLVTGYHPEGWPFYIALMVPGALISLRSLWRRYGVSAEDR